MKNVASWVMVMVALIFGATVPLTGGPAKPKKGIKEKKQILVYAQKKGNGIEYVCGGQRYSGKQLDDVLGEWHVDAARDSEVVVVPEDNLLLSDVKDVPAMAMKAGFYGCACIRVLEGNRAYGRSVVWPLDKSAKAGNWRDR